jgi:DASH complex subunit SPC19
MRSYRQSQGPHRSRLSHHKGRESIFTSGADNYREDGTRVFSPSLRECVLAMEDCCEEVRKKLISLNIKGLCHRRPMRLNSNYVPARTTSLVWVKFSTTNVYDNVKSCLYAFITLLKQVFLLVGENTVQKYQADLGGEIDPQIIELVSRAEKGMKALQMKESILRAKVRADQLSSDY